MNKICFSDDEFDNIYESIEDIYTEKNAIEKEKDPYIQAKKRVKELFKYNGKRGTITVDGGEHKITFNKGLPTSYNSVTNVINLGGDTQRKFTDNDLKFRILHELGHKKSNNEINDKKNLSRDIVNKAINNEPMYKLDKISDFKSKIKKVENLLKKNKKASMDDVRKQLPEDNDQSIKTILKYARLSIRAGKNNNQDNTHEKISDYVNKKHGKTVNTNSHFNTEEAMADEFARKNLGIKNAKKAINRLYNRSSYNIDVFNILLNELKQISTKKSDIHFDDNSLIGSALKKGLISKEDIYKILDQKDELEDFINRPSVKMLRELTNNKFIRLLSSKEIRDDFNARKKLVKDKKFKELSKDLHKPQTVKESSEYDKIQVLREAVEERFLNDELTYEEYAMVIDRLDEKEI